MMGGRKGHPGPKMTRAEAVPAVRTKSNNKVPITPIERKNQAAFLMVGLFKAFSIRS